MKKFFKFQELLKKNEVPHRGLSGTLLGGGQASRGT